MLTRRQLLIQSILLATAGKVASQGIKPLHKRFQIGACDWSLGMGSDIRAFGIAQKIGLDGLMVDIGSPANNIHLREKEVQQQYLQESSKTNIKISSLAIGALNNYPYKSDPQTDQWVWDSIGIATNLKVPVILLAFFHKNDLRNDQAGIKNVIEKLKKVAPHAEKANVILGIESYLNGADHLRILEAVGSPSVKVYMDFRNTADAGWKVLDELELIGAQNICELHMKENGKLLGKGDLPWQKISEKLAQMNYTGDGWMQIESSNPETADVVTNYKHNLAFLQQMFHS